MKTTNILWAFALVTLAIACTNEEAARKDNSKEPTITQKTAFVGGTLNTKATRTSLDMVYPGGTQVNYFWEQGDKIWTATGDNGVAQITGKAATATFYLSNVYTTPTVTLYYPGKNATVYNQVTIADEQIQTVPNNTQHLGETGDCGTATAYQQSDKSYHFDLDHKAAYLCFLPHTTNTILAKCKLKRIEVTADKDIAGNYILSATSDLSANGIGSKTITLQTGGENGFALTNTTTSQATNAAYMVIAPGTYNLTVKYYLVDPAIGQEGTVTKNISATFLANTVTPIESNLTATSYDGRYNIYMWDAKDTYWHGYESEWPIATSGSIPPTAHIPQNASDSRWYHVITIPYGQHPQASQSCAICPNGNEVSWYVRDGDPHWDIEIWTVRGHAYAGGMWFKKRGKIPNFNSNVASTGYDRREDFYGVGSRGDVFNVSPPKGRPSPLSDYFFLPALGACWTDYSSYQNGMGTTYWTSTPCDDLGRPYSKAWYLSFSESSVASSWKPLTMGFVVWPASEFK